MNVTKLSGVRETLVYLHCGYFAFWDSMLRRRYAGCSRWTGRATAPASGDVGLWREYE